MRQVRGMRVGLGAIGRRWRGFRLGLRLSGNGMGETMAFSIEQVKLWHGVDGNGCGDRLVWPSRRSYIRHRDRRNQTRSRKRYEQLQTLTAEPGVLPSITYAVLVVYREPGYSPVHGIAAEVWHIGAELRD
jgi:hypothetical protein